MAAATATALVAGPPAAGAGATPAAPPTRLGANPADTTVTRLVAVLTASDPDELLIPSDSPVITAFPFLQWMLPPPGSRLVKVAMCELQGVCITACNFDLADPSLARVLRSANLVEHGLSAAACSAILHELHDARVLDDAHKSESDFWEALTESSLLNRAALCT
ncbi:hypothetical protein AB1Y20_015418 [Prymnesium parvum]|uniref:Uncharacterized protein n=1 Tax=Prymnesium parvum TaxID=97485 RepID=A0AB34K0T9_PRYPA